MHSEDIIEEERTHSAVSDTTHKVSERGQEVEEEESESCFTNRISQYGNTLELPKNDPLAEGL